jgi:hypothetical protein
MNSAQLEARGPRSKHVEIGAPLVWSRAGPQRTDHAYSLGTRFLQSRA